MKIIQNLKTSDKITFLFTIFNFISLIFLLVSINIIYFFAWYSDQKKESMYDMNMNYSMYISEKTDTNLEAFKKYILQKDTLIIPNDGGNLICSNGVDLKVHNDIERIKDRFFYSNEGKTYFIFSRYYDEIGQVKVFFDTTPYVKSQLLIIKISLLIIFISLFLYVIIGRKISKLALKNLKNISEKSKKIDIEKELEEIIISGNKEDEINILADTLNKSFSHIKNQTSNLKQFISDVSHEFKTPLMVINSQIDLYNKKLEKDKLNCDDTKILLEKISQNTKKLNKILELFLQLSRIENKIEKFEKSEVVLDQYLKKISKDYLSTSKKDIKIIYQTKKDILIDINKDTFNVLFENLLGNALKFTKTQIEIGCDKNIFWIKDDGIGIEKERLKDIWNKFYKIDKSQQGFGIGLFIVKRLVNIYNWQIEVKSEESKGTKFIIKF